MRGRLPHLEIEGTPGRCPGAPAAAETRRTRDPAGTLHAGDRRKTRLRPASSAPGVQPEEQVPEVPGMRHRARRAIVRARNDDEVPATPASARVPATAAGEMPAVLHELRGGSEAPPGDRRDAAAAVGEGEAGSPLAAAPPGRRNAAEPGSPNAPANAMKERTDRRDRQSRRQRVHSPHESSAATFGRTLIRPPFGRRTGTGGYRVQSPESTESPGSTGRSPARGRNHRHVPHSSTSGNGN